MNSITTRALLAAAQSGLTWFPWTRLRPRADQPFGLHLVLIQALTAFVFVGALLSFAFWVVLHVVDPVVFITGGLVGAVARGLWFLMLRMTWNQRLTTTPAPPLPVGSLPQCVVSLALRLSLLIAAIALVYALENLRGSLALRALDAELAARHAGFQLADVVPPPVPDEKNFAMSRLFKPMLDYEYADPTSLQITGGWRDPAGWKYGQEMLRVESAEPKSSLQSFQKSSNAPPEFLSSAKKAPAYAGTFAAGDVTDLALWQAYYRWLPDWPKPSTPGSPGRDVLLGLSKSDADVEELHRAAKERPLSRFPIAYERGPAALLPHLASLKRSVTHLKLRAVAHLAEQQPDAALADTQLALRLSDLLADEPILISLLVRVAMDRITLQAIWEGCREGGWNEAQLRSLQESLATRSHVAAFARALRGEGALARVTYDLVIRNPKEALDYGQDAQAGELSGFALFVRWAPRGWIRLNEVSHLRYLDAFTAQISADTPFTQSPAEEGAQDALLQKYASGRTIDRVVARMYAPVVSTRKLHEAEAWNRLALVGLALERHRLAEGRYPEHLDALSPKYLATVPRDPMDGQPLRYRRSGEKGFTLYSLGLDLRDDQGARVKTGTSTVGGAPSGDLVWR
ncbi:MAG: hypothetical protein IT580_08805 [Verrucomicrobiales bacterium]|nr:hypothetical protein [Verrucomicrobiales bacterium]